MNQVLEVLHYTTPVTDRDGAAKKPVRRALTALGWAVAGVCIAVWALVGALFWIPLLVRRILTYSAALVPAMLRDEMPDRAAKRLRSAVSFYVRGFKATVAMVSREPPRDDQPARFLPEDGLRGVKVVGEILWAALVWYGVLYLTGVAQGTPQDVWRWMVAVPWQERVGDPVMEWVRSHRP